ncbi:hypothetical protein Tco_0999639 [Tanacetum coccineum]
MRKAYGGVVLGFLRLLPNRSCISKAGKINGEFHFEPEGGLGDGEDSSPSTKYVNNKARVIDVEPLNSAPPSKVTKNTKDLNDLFIKKDVADEVRKVGKSSKVTRKRRHIAEDPDIHEFPSAKELKDSTDCHWVVAYVTPPSWKQHLKEISLEKARTSYVISSYVISMIREKEKEKAYVELERKCNDALQDLDKSPLVLDMHAEIETLQGIKSSKTYLLQEINGLRQDRVAVVAKVVPYVAMKLVCSDEIGASVWEKMHGYHPSSKKAFDQAGDDLATTSYPFISEATVDPYASLEVLLSKTLKSLRAKPAPSTSNPSSSKAPNLVSSYVGLIFPWNSTLLALLIEVSFIALASLVLMSESSMLRIFELVLSHRCALKATCTSPTHRNYGDKYDLRYRSSSMILYYGVLTLNFLAFCGSLGSILDRLPPKLLWLVVRRLLKPVCLKHLLFCSDLAEHAPWNNC